MSSVLLFYARRYVGLLQNQWKSDPLFACRDKALPLIQCTSAAQRPGRAHLVVYGFIFVALLLLFAGLSLPRKSKAADVRKMDHATLVSLLASVEERQRNAALLRVVEITKEGDAR